MDNLNTWIVSLEQLKTYRDQIAQDDTPQAAAVVASVNVFADLLNTEHRTQLDTEIGACEAYLGI